MMTSHKAEGYSTVSPYLVVDGPVETIQFLMEVSDAKELRRFSAEDDGLAHAEVRLDDTIIILADTNDDLPSVLSHVQVYVEDVDQVYQRSLAAGGQSIKEPDQQAEEEDRRAGVAGSGGTTWWIATRVS